MIIHELAKLSNISIRTLRYYDEIDLLKPASINSSGYRVYDDYCIEKLQQILFYKELNFSLSQIKTIINDNNFDKEKALIEQRTLLKLKQQRLNNLINLIDSLIKGENKTSLEEFSMKEIEKAKQKYQDEAKAKWGNTQAFKQSQKRTNSYTDEQWKEIKEEYDSILQGFSKLVDTDPNDKTALELVDKWKNHINKYYYDCDNSMLDNLADMYISDERFIKNMDKYKEGTTAYIVKAIKIYCKQ